MTLMSTAMQSKAMAFIPAVQLSRLHTIDEPQAWTCSQLVNVDGQLVSITCTITSELTS